MKDIEGELQDLNELERQECGTGEPKHPSARPLASELGFKDTPSATEILEAATIQRGLRLKKPHLIFAKLAKLDPASESGEAAKLEAQYDPKIERTRKRIEYGDIKEATEIKWPKLSKLDRLIAENYFESQKLKRPLRELSANNASVELAKLGVDISPKAFERALKRLCLVDAVADYRAEEDKLDDFLKECTCDLPGASVAHSVVFESYRAWAVMNGLRYLLTPRMLARRLRAHGWREEKDSEGNSRWIGFSLSLVD